MSVSVLILTLNEELNLIKCLSSVSWCDDIVILDSFSTDKTRNIAESFEVRFVQRKFDDYASQRNYGIDKIKYKHRWLLMVDADEVIPDKFYAEIKHVIAKSNEAVTLFRMRRKDFFMGRWIKRSSGYPTWFGRLIKIGRVSVKRSINEEYHTDGEIGLLKEHLHHFPFNKGFSSWIEKHNRYSTMEAEAMVSEYIDNIKTGSFFHKDPVIRRKTIKAFVYSMPFRPLLIFFGLYFFRFGFLDGGPGLIFCILRAFYEFMIDCKVKEIKRKDKGLFI